MTDLIAIIISIIFIGSMWLIEGIRERKDKDQQRLIDYICKRLSTIEEKILLYDIKKEIENHRESGE
jgi:hypothetical protein